MPQLLAQSYVRAIIRGINLRLHGFGLVAGRTKVFRHRAEILLCGLIQDVDTLIARIRPQSLQRRKAETITTIKFRSTRRLQTPEDAQNLRRFRVI